MENTFRLLGLSFKNTSIEIREKLALIEEDAKRLIQFIATNTEAGDVMVLSTCNRTEIYYSSQRDLAHEICTAIGLQKGISIAAVEEYFSNKKEGEEAILHLFNVSMGLDAQVVGDIQISNQVKKAYQWSADEQAAGPLLHRLMHTIFFANKRVVQETSFRDGAASVSYATKELIDDVTGEFIDPKILVLGLGEIGMDVCRNYAGSNRDVTIANRTLEKAQSLAAECNLKYVTYESALDNMKEYDVIVSSVAAQTPVINKTILADSEILTHKFFIDLSVPRSIDHDIEDIHGVLLYNIDDIQSKASAALEQRVASIPAVRSIIDECLNEFSQWSTEMSVSPTIKKLKGALESIRQEELKKYLKDSDSKEAKIADAVTKSMMQKIIKLPVLQLKAACKRGEAETLIDVLNDLFDLDKQSAEAK